DSRESRLGPAADAQVRELWPGARVVSLADAGDAALSSSARGDLRGALLIAALLCGLAEVMLASWWPSAAWTETRSGGPSDGPRRRRSWRGGCRAGVRRCAWPASPDRAPRRWRPGSHAWRRSGCSW